MTTIRSAWRVVLRRCAMMIVVTRPESVSRVRRIAASAMLSTALVASSRIRMSGLRSRARASAMRCRSPPQSCVPLNPDGRVVALGQGLDEVVDLRLHGRGTNPLERGVRLAVGDVVADGLRAELRVLPREADPAPPALELDLRERHSVDTDFAGRRIGDATEQIDQGRLAGAGSADQSERLALLDLERDVGERAARSTPRAAVYTKPTRSNTIASRSPVNGRMPGEGRRRSRIASRSVTSRTAGREDATRSRNISQSRA